MRRRSRGWPPRVAGKEVSARELVSAALDRIEATDAAIGAFVAVDAERRSPTPTRIDARVAAGEDVGPLAGIPIGVKDIEDAAGFLTTQGSLLFADAAPADGRLAARRPAAGGRVRRRRQDQHARAGLEGATPTNRSSVAPRNPWDTGRSPGGSSGGSAAAVAAGHGAAGHRAPTAAARSASRPSLCGLTGMKPSLGRVPVGGPQPARAGPTSRPRARWRARVRDAAPGPRRGDRTRPDRPALAPDARRSRGVDALDDLHPPRRVVWSPTLGYAPVDPEVRAVCERAVEALDGAGTEVIESTTCSTPTRPRRG